MPLNSMFELFVNLQRFLGRYERREFGPDDFQIEFAAWPFEDAGDVSPVLVARGKFGCVFDSGRQLGQQIVGGAPFRAGLDQYRQMGIGSETAVRPSAAKPHRRSRNTSAQTWRRHVALRAQHRGPGRSSLLVAQPVADALLLDQTTGWPQRTGAFQTKLGCKAQCGLVLAQSAQGCKSPRLHLATGSSPAPHQGSGCMPLGLRNRGPHARILSLNREWCQGIHRGIRYQSILRDRDFGVIDGCNPFDRNSSAVALAQPCHGASLRPIAA